MDWLVVLVVGMLGGGTVGAVAVKWLNRDVDTADAALKRSQANKTDVENLRDIIAEVRESERLKDQRIAVQDEKIDALIGRVDKLEERERHMLTRAAVHEAWDQMAFATLLTMHPGYQPPPPLGIAAPEHGDGEQ